MAVVVAAGAGATAMVETLVSLGAGAWPCAQRGILTLANEVQEPAPRLYEFRMDGLGTEKKSKESGIRSHQTWCFLTKLS